MGTTNPEYGTVEQDTVRTLQPITWGDSRPGEEQDFRATIEQAFAAEPDEVESAVYEGEEEQFPAIRETVTPEHESAGPPGGAPEADIPEAETETAEAPAGPGGAPDAEPFPPVPPRSPAGEPQGPADAGTAEISHQKLRTPAKA